MQCFLSNKTHKKAEIPRVIPHPSSHMEFEKFATFSEGVILDEIDRHRKEEKEKQREIDELYKKLLEKENGSLRDKEDEALKEAEDEKKEVLNRSRSCDKIKSPLSLPNAKTEAGGLRLKTSGSSKKLSNKLPPTLSQLHSRRWY